MTPDTYREIADLQRRIRELEKLEDGGGGGPPSGAAGGVLSGTYPDPGFAVDMATQAELDAHTALTTTAHGGIVASTDPRLTDSRTPTAHATSHHSGSSDPLTLGSIAGSLVIGQVPNDLITYAKIQNVSATDKLLGRSTAGAGDVEEIPLTSAGRTLLAIATRPAVSVWRSGEQTGITLSTFIKVQFNTENFDTNSNFDATTNYRFQPTVAGKYVLAASITLDTKAFTTGRLIVALYKDGAEHKRFCDLNDCYGGSGTTVVDANGSSNYFEIFVFQSWGTGTTVAGFSEVYSHFSGAHIL